MTTFSGAFSGRPFRLDLEITEGAPDIGANTSPVGWVLNIVQTGTQDSFRSDPSSWSVNIDGQAWSGAFTYDFRSYNALQIGSGSATITHNPDGTKTASASASANGGSPIGTASASGSMALTRIPRFGKRWDGTQEVPLSEIKRWDGTQEVRAA